MRITEIKTYPVWVGRRNQCLLKIETDEGVYGWGEAGLSGRELAVEGALRHYAELLVGRDPMRRGALWQELYRSQYFEGGRVLVAAISAIDIALHDIAGKALGVPVYELLGGRVRDTVPCFTTVDGSTTEAIAERAAQFAAAGWRALRLPVLRPDSGEDEALFEPRESIAATAELATEVRRRLRDSEAGRSVALGIDYHHRLSVAEAASFCARLAPGTLDFLEEPIRAESPQAYAALLGMTEIPFAIGEEFASKWAFLPFIEQGVTSFARLDVCNVGGFTEAMKVAALAETHYIDVMPHNPLGPICTAASIHLAAACPNFAWLETWAGTNSDDELFPLQPQLLGASYRVPTTAGLGIEVNEDRAASESFRYWEAPHWHRRDGSYTNW